MPQDKVMLLIDADNVSLDVIEQAMAWVARHYGGPHVRRAYCTAESAVKHQGAFKRLGIRPMVNLAAGKNSTDIALAVDAIDLTLSERPQVVVIASSDSDFAPLVSRLREKGSLVVGVGQRGKTGDETRGVYDDYEVLEHRRDGRRSGAAAGRPAPVDPQAAPAQATTPAPAAPKGPAGAQAPGTGRRSRRRSGGRSGAAPSAGEGKDRSLQAPAAAREAAVAAVPPAPVESVPPPSPPAPSPRGGRAGRGSRRPAQPASAPDAAPPAGPTAPTAGAPPASDATPGPESPSPLAGDGLGRGGGKPRRRRPAAKSQGTPEAAAPAPTATPPDAPGV